MKVQVNISAKRIADMMIGAVEGNHMTRSWCAGVTLEGVWKDRLAKRPGALADPWYSDPKLYDSPEFTLEVCELSDERTGKIKRHRINRTSFEKGIAKMAAEAGDHFGDMMAENDDNVTQDVFLQYVALGKLVYG